MFRSRSNLHMHFFIQVKNMTFTYKIKVAMKYRSLIHSKCLLVAFLEAKSSIIFSYEILSNISFSIHKIAKPFSRS